MLGLSEVSGHVYIRIQPFSGADWSLVTAAYYGYTIVNRQKLMHRDRRNDMIYDCMHDARTTERDTTELRDNSLEHVLPTP